VQTDCLPFYLSLLPLPERERGRNVYSIEKARSSFRFAGVLDSRRCLVHLRAVDADWGPRFAAALASVTCGQLGMCSPFAASESSSCIARPALKGQRDNS
jgi:hypothetical protein